MSVNPIDVRPVCTWRLLDSDSDCLREKRVDSEIRA